MTGGKLRRNSKCCVVFILLLVVRARSDSKNCRFSSLGALHSIGACVAIAARSNAMCRDVVQEHHASKQY